MVELAAEDLFVPALTTCGYRTDTDGYPGRYHYGGTLAFGPDDMLYLTLGDKSKSSWAQDMTKTAGKILRFRRDGSVPLDNYG